MKRKYDQKGDQLYKRLGKSTEEHLSIEEYSSASESLEKRYSKAYKKLKKEYIVEDIELDLENVVAQSIPKS